MAMSEEGWGGGSLFGLLSPDLFAEDDGETREGTRKEEEAKKQRESYAAKTNQPKV